MLVIDIIRPEKKPELSQGRVVKPEKAGAGVGLPPKPEKAGAGVGLPPKPVPMPNGLLPKAAAAAAVVGSAPVTLNSMR